MSRNVSTEETIVLRQDQSAIVFDNDGENMTVYIPNSEDPDSSMEISVTVLMALASRNTPVLAALYDAAYAVVTEEIRALEAKNAGSV